MIPSNEAITKQRAFERAYMLAEPFNRYVNGCSLQTVGFISRLHRDVVLDGEPEGLCLYVFLEKQLPYGMFYPREFDGMPVVTRVVGEIRDEEPIYESGNESE